MIKVNDLSFSYGSRQVLSEISAHWEQGDLISLIGENGSGKSTLLKLLCGIFKSDEGQILIKGKELSSRNLKERSKLISYIPQSSSPDGGICVYDFILMGRKPWFGWQDSHRDRERVFQTMEQFSMEKMAMRKMGELSGGERQKVYIARALIQDTPIILLDEPTNNLDIRFQIELMEILSKESTTKGKLIIMAVHDINLALRYTDKVLMLKNGKIISKGSVHSALNEKAISSTMSISSEIIDHKGIKIMVPQ